MEDKKIYLFHDETYIYESELLEIFRYYQRGEIIRPDIIKLIKACALEHYKTLFYQKFKELNTKA